jgi:hypothetical protein
MTQMLSIKNRMVTSLMSTVNMTRINTTGWYGCSLQGVSLSYVWLGHEKYEAEFYADAQGFISMEYYNEGDLVPSHI